MKRWPQARTTSISPETRKKYQLNRSKPGIPAPIDDPGRSETTDDIPAYPFARRTVTSSMRAMGILPLAALVSGSRHCTLEADCARRESAMTVSAMRRMVSGRGRGSVRSGVGGDGGDFPAVHQERPPTVGSDPELSAILGIWWRTACWGALLTEASSAGSPFGRRRSPRSRSACVRLTDEFHSDSCRAVTLIPGICSRMCGGDGGGGDCGVVAMASKAWLALSPVHRFKLDAGTTSIR